MSKPDPFSDRQNLAMRAIILYDDFAAGARANAILRRAAHQAHDGMKCNIKPWRVDMLRMPLVAEEALLESAGAHVILFAGGFVQSPPSWLTAWLKQWAVCRQNHEVALAIVGDGKGHPFPPVAARELSQFARQHQLYFIFDESVASRGDPELLVRHLKEYTLPALLISRHADRPSAYDTYRRWGINE